jgi:23S rRNA pseudouridine1911/1915/1917 synthase
VAGERFSFISDEEGKRLDVYLSEKLSLTRTRVKNMLEGNHVSVDGKNAKPSLKVKRQMHLEGVIPEDEPIKLVPQAIPLSILYMDEYLMIIDKPAGMVVHPSFGHSDGTLVNAVLSFLQEQPPDDPPTGSEGRLLNCRPGIVHRLDKGTSGAIIVARDPKTQEILSSRFKERRMEKTYRTILEGIVKTDTGIITGNIGRHPTDRKKMAVLKDRGRQADTSYAVLERMSGFTYVEVYPKTGRTHQIRVHFAYSGHPVVGDELYGKAARLLTPRPLLHAFRISFTHPVTGLPLRVEAPVPPDMEEFVKKNGGLMI